MANLRETASQGISLAWIERSSTLSLDTADPLARIIVTDKEHIEDVLTDDLIIYLDHVSLGLSDLERDDGHHR